MDYGKELAKLLAQSQSFHKVGDKPFMHRPLGQKIKKLCTTGVLSITMMLQALSPVLAQTANPFIPPPQTQMEQVQAPSDASQSVMLVNPLENLQSVQPFLNQSGMVDTHKVVEYWQDKGISQENILSLAQLMFMTQGPVFVHSAVDAQKVEGLSERTQAMFELQNNEEAQNFLTHYNLLKFVNANLLAPAQVFVNDLVPNKTTTSHALLETTIQGLTNSSTTLSLSHHAVTYNQAITHLSEAFQQTGLRTLKVPLPSWTSPGHLNNVALNLAKANQEIGNAVGYTGKMFDVGEGIDLVLGIPEGTSVTQTQSDGRIYMEASSSTLAHELFHAWYSSSEDASFVDTLDHLDQQMEQKSATLENSYYKQAEKFKESLGGYFQDQTERMAYQFSAFVYTVNNGHDTASTNRDSVQNEAGMARPSQEEARAMVTLWQNTLPQLKQPSWHEAQAPQTTVTAQLETLAPENIASETLAPVTVQSLKQFRANRALPATTGPVLASSSPQI